MLGKACNGNNTVYLLLNSTFRLECGEYMGKGKTMTLRRQNLSYCAWELHRNKDCRQQSHNGGKVAAIPLHMIGKTG